MYTAAAAAVTQCGQQRFPIIAQSAGLNHIGGRREVPFHISTPPPYPQTKGIHFTRSLLLGLQTPSPEGASGGRGVKDTRWVLGEVSLVANTPLGANPPGV